MAGNVKLMTSAGGGVILDTATTTASDVTVKVPVTGVNNGTLVCSDSSGNVGIGATPNSWSLLKSVQVSGGASLSGYSGNTYLGSNWYYDGSERYIANGFATLYSMSSDGLHTWKTAASGTAGSVATMTERMRIDSSGNLLVGTTSAVIDSSGKFHVKNSTASGVAACIQNTTSGTSTVCIDNNGSGTAYLVGWFSNGTYRSNVYWNGSNIVYGTGSDARLKENIVDAPSGLEKLAKVKVRSFDWKENGAHTKFGVIAQEMELIAPECVIPPQTDENGNEITTYSVDASVLVPAMIKAIQELKAELDATKAQLTAVSGEVAALKGAA